MPNPHKADVLEALRGRFGEVRKIAGSESLFSIGEDSARVYFRYSKVHASGRTFFGLRSADLRQLEGHNSFLCFLLGDEPSPLFVPYADFEEVFHNAQPAKDGQYKVQVYRSSGTLELYVARQGRFNAEGYVGLETLARSMDASRLREARSLTHSQVQTLLAGIGNMKGYEVWLPSGDIGRLDWSLTRQFALRARPPVGFREIRTVLCEIDVVWVAPGRDVIEGLFEVEYSTPVYSGLLRFNDVLLTDPKVSRFSIVSNDSRREVFARQLFRPTFRKSGLAELCSFLEYANVFSWHQRLMRRGADGSPQGWASSVHSR
jgi:hypothetical protein